MAYAAGLGLTAPEYLDTLGPEGIVPHPLFPVCYEWPAVLALRDRTLPVAVSRRGVHATHDLAVHRPPRAGERLSTIASVTLVQARAPGAYVLIRLETRDAAGELVTTTEHGSLYLGVGCDPPAAPAPASRPVEPLAEPGPGGLERGATPGAGMGWTAQVPVEAGLAHVYSECARIWNPIHTDRAAALAAGLPDIILHGTATLALAVSAVLAREGPRAAARVRRIGCRFGGLVRMPSVLTVSGRPAGDAGARWIGFEVLSPEGSPAVRDGRVLLDTPP